MVIFNIMIRAARVNFFQHFAPKKYYFERGFSYEGCYL